MRYPKRLSGRSLAGIGAAVLLIGLYAGNSSYWTYRISSEPTVLLHRGFSQQFDLTGVDSDTCTASRIYKPEHDLLENTLPSIAASFAAGAKIVEIDVHPTVDGEFAVFHDWTLDCRTDGSGVTRDHSMSDLKKLDVGYGYTADGGETFPFRGKGKGMMPTLKEVLITFPTGLFLINVKSNDPTEGWALADAIRGYQARVLVYGGDKPVSALSEILPGVPVTSKRILRECLSSYLLIGWSGTVPRSCNHSIVFVPINMAPFLWGWPNLLLNRMESVGSVVFVVGPYTGSDLLTGVDVQMAERLISSGYNGGIFTNDPHVLLHTTERPVP
jgi:glycerophosphoryl diester phosphodiesterase